jgi:hypothetical protein
MMSSMPRLSRLPIAVVCAASAVVVVALGTRLTFFNDDWFILLQRPGLNADAVLAPHNGHLIALPVLVYKAFVELFGLDSQLPFRMLLAVVIAGLGALVYVLVSERLGRVAGLVAATILVFLGPAWEDLLWSFQIGLVGSLVAGLGALLALERDTPRRNAVACALLVVSISCSDTGIPLVVAATVAIALRRDPRQLWIPAVPTILFAIWWLTYGNDAPSTFSSANLRHLPGYVFDSVQSGLASTFGLNRGGWFAYSETRVSVLTAVVGLAVAAWLIRTRHASAWVLVFLSGALAFWGLAGANYVAGRAPEASRYQLVDVTFLILIAAELFRAVRLRPWQTASVLAVALFAFGSNIHALRNGFYFMRHHAIYAKADLGVLELAGTRTPPTLTLTEPVAGDPYLIGVIAGLYFAVIDAHGSPATYSAAQIATAPVVHRQAADRVLVAADRLHLDSALEPASRRGCRRAATGDIELRSGTTSVTNLGPAPLDLRIRRFGPPDSAAPVGTVLPQRTARLAIPRDSAALPWHLVTQGPAVFRVCGPLP